MPEHSPYKKIRLFGRFLLLVLVPGCVDIALAQTIDETLPTAPIELPVSADAEVGRPFTFEAIVEDFNEPDEFAPSLSISQPVDGVSFGGASDRCTSRASYADVR